MKIGIIVAMDREYDRVKALQDDSGRIGGHDIALVRGGIGKVNAALATCELIASAKPDAIISTGVAGGADAAVADVLDVVVGEEVAYHDVDCGPGNAPGQVQGLPRVFKADAALVAAAAGCGASGGARVVRGLIATGDQFVSSEEATARIRALYPNVAAVDMESAAIAHACHLRKVPFLALRVVSDVPGTPNHFAQYEDFWDRVGANSFDVLKQLLVSLGG